MRINTLRIKIKQKTTPIWGRFFYQNPVGLVFLVTGTYETQAIRLGSNFKCNLL